MLYKNRKVSKVIASLLAVVMMLPAAVSVTAAGSWQKSDQGWMYQREDGSYVRDGWQKDGSKWYFFNEEGIMCKGWVKVHGNYYYLTNDGSMKTGWLKLHGAWYLLNEDGMMKTGWVKFNGDWYYLQKDGSMAKNTTVQDPDGTSYLINQEGVWYSTIYPGSQQLSSGTTQRIKVTTSDLVKIGKWSSSGTTDGIHRSDRFILNFKDTSSVDIYYGDDTVHNCDTPDHLTAHASYSIQEYGEDYLLTIHPFVARQDYGTLTFILQIGRGSNLDPNQVVGYSSINLILKNPSETSFRFVANGNKYTATTLVSR